ncbi:hypothetical protein GGS26DRAFT_214068 [Hypomontagnella submonticulosa]|nr:hypothetical protein GGS26DRAFT_214068 [Hypomontagnella submonticulosa]
MCQYVTVTYRCGHKDLLAGPGCADLMNQLSRIHTEPAAWTTAGRQTLPFKWADECHPGPDNTTDVISDAWCGWECRNSTDGVNWDEVADILASTCADVDVNRDSGIESGASHKGPDQQVQDNTTNDAAGPYHVSNAGRMSWYWDYSSAEAGAMGGAGTTLAEPGSSSQEGAGTGAQEVAEEFVSAGSGRIGMPDAQYGVPRKGVGWQEGESNAGFLSGDPSQAEVITANDWSEDGTVFD